MARPGEMSRSRSHTVGEYGTARGVKLVTALLLMSVAAGARHRAAHIDDDSDWWSVLNPQFVAWKLKPHSVGPTPSNFLVRNVALGPDLLEQAAAEFGASTTVYRGDAAFGRSQVCYVSSEGPPPAYLVFEKGEVNYTFYFFRSAGTWTGRDLCLKSPRVTPGLRTGSGLHLGQPRAQVEAILGRPSAVLADRILYVFETKVSIAPSERQRRGESPPHSGDDRSHSFSGSFLLSVRIEARFLGSKLSYLMVSKAETE